MFKDHIYGLMIWNSVNFTWFKISHSVFLILNIYFILFDYIIVIVTLKTFAILHQEEMKNFGVEKYVTFSKVEQNWACSAKKKKCQTEQK